MPTSRPSMHMLRSLTASEVSKVMAELYPLEENHGTELQSRTPAGPRVAGYAAGREAERRAEIARSDGGTAGALAVSGFCGRGRDHTRDGRGSGPRTCFAGPR